MSDYDDDDTNNSNDGGALRKQLEKALKEMNDLKAENTKFKAEKVATAVGSKLSEKGFKPEAARFVPQDVGSDPARLDAWITENEGLLARKEAAPPVEAVETVTEGGTHSLDPASTEAFTKIQAVSNGSAAVVDIDALQAKMLACKTEEEFNNLIGQYRIG